MHIGSDYAVHWSLAVFRILLVFYCFQDKSALFFFFFKFQLLLCKKAARAALVIVLAGAELTAWLKRLRSCSWQTLEMKEQQNRSNT